MTAEPTTTAAAVSAIGRKRPHRIDDRLLERHPVADTQLDEIHEDDRVAHDDPGAGDEPDHRRGREKGAHGRVHRQDADERERIAAMMVMGVVNDWNHPTTRM